MHGEKDKDYLIVCLFQKRYSLNDAGRIMVLGRGICSAP
jgi:hypothetical protein